MNLNEFNNLESTHAEKILMSFCSNQIWSSAVMSKRPYFEVIKLKEEAHAQWLNLTEAEKLAVVQAHPKLGASEDALNKNPEHKTFSIKEQENILKAKEVEKEFLNELNAQYFSRFGFVFLLCATGKLPSEILAILQKRLKNGREQELSNAFFEIDKIIALRIENYFS